MTPPTLHSRPVDGRRMGSAALILLFWLVAIGSAWGQAPTATTPRTSPNAKSATTSAAPDPPATVPLTKSESPMSPEAAESPKSTMYGMVKSENGTTTFVPLPRGTDNEDFLEWLAAARGPGYGINSVKLTGQVRENDLIELQAVVTIVVLRENEWVRVPLGFNEAMLADVIQHEGEGSWSYVEFDGETVGKANNKEEGHVCSLRGMGKHQLTLSLLVPLVNDVVDETGLELTPPSQAATTSLTLEFPEDIEANAKTGVLREFHPAEGTTEGSSESTTENMTTAGTTIEWVGPGGRIDLAWHPRPETALPADLTVKTNMVVSLTPQECEIRARQTITPAKGRIATVEVLLPEGFSFVSVEGEYYRPGTARVSEDGRQVTVDLREPRAVPVELNWRVTAPRREDAPLRISGFSIPEVPETAQSGDIKFERTAAYAIHFIEDGEATTGVTEIGKMETGRINVAAAYEFEQQPFALSFTVESITPKYVVKPELIFTIHPDRLDLDATFGVSVDEGELKEMRFLWPVEDWNITQIRDGYIQELGSRSPDQSPPIEIQVPSGISFEIPIFASALRENAAGTFSVPLPRLEAMDAEAIPTRQDRVLAIRHPNNLRVEIRAADGSVLKKVEDPSAIRLPTPTDNESMPIFLIPETITAIEFEVTRIQQQITANTAITVRPLGEALMVEQRFVYGISYAPLSQLHFQIPENIYKQGLEFIDGGGIPCPVEAVKTSDGMVEVVVNLATSIQGRVSLMTRYDIAPGIDRAQTGTFTMPVILPTDGEFEQVRLDISQLPYHRVTIQSPDWTRIEPETTNAEQAVDELSWQSSSLPAAIPLTLAQRPPDAVIQPTMTKVLLRTAVDRQGRVHTVVDCLLDRPGTPLVLEFPAEAVPRWFRWRGNVIDPTTSEVDGETHVALMLEKGAGEPILSFEYDVKTPNSLGFIDSEQIPAVDFGEGIAVDEVLWRLTLPESEHLFTNPSAYAPRFQWQVDSGLWSRETIPSLRAVQDWFGAELTAIRPEFENGHEYVFSRTGGVEPMAFTIVAKSLVVLIGAGLAILLGYAFANALIPYPRYALLGIVVTMLLAWAFFPNQVRIMLQPLILGLFLVGAALVAERVLQHRQDRLAAESSPSAVDFVTILPGEGSTSSPPAGIGSEEQTVVRAGIGRDSSHGTSNSYQNPLDGATGLEIPTPRKTPTGF